MKYLQKGQGKRTFMYVASAFRQDEHNKPLLALETPKQPSKRLLCGRLFLVEFKFFLQHLPHTTQ